jgi:hypothetical protein
VALGGVAAALGFAQGWFSLLRTQNWSRRGEILRSDFPDPQEEEKYGDINV